MPREVMPCFQVLDEKMHALMGKLAAYISEIGCMPGILSELYRPLFSARGFPHRFVIWRGGPRREDVSCAGGMGEKWCSNQISHTYLLARRSARQLKHYQTTSSLS